MTTRNDDTAKKTCSCKGKTDQEAAPGLFLKTMDTVDRALVRAVRLWAASGGDPVKVGVLFSADAGFSVPDSVLQSLAGLIASMDDDAGPDIALREPTCGKTTPSERAIVRLVNAMGDGDAATAQACATALVSPARARHVMREAFMLATALEPVRDPAVGATAWGVTAPARAAC